MKYAYVVSRYLDTLDMSDCEPIAVFLDEEKAKEYVKGLTNEINERIKTTGLRVGEEHWFWDYTTVEFMG